MRVHKCISTVFLCCAIQFPSENAMKDPRIDRVTGLCRKIVSTFSHSWLRRRNLAMVQKELKLPEHQLKTECPTRWGSLPNASPAPPMKKGRKTLGSFFKAAQGNDDKSSSLEQAVSTELEAYLLTCNIDREDDPLIWWRQNSNVYPRLSVLVKKYLCIPAPSSPSERLFSTNATVHH